MNIQESVSYTHLDVYKRQENNNEVELLKLLYQTLRILCRDSVPKALIRVIYELRIFVVNGEYPECFHCICCGEEKGLGHFSPMRNGVVCDKCLPEAGQVLPLDPSALYAACLLYTSRCV